MFVASTTTLRRGLAWIMVGVLVVSVVAWYVTRDTLPRQIRIATGAKGGQYHKLGEHLKTILEARKRRDVIVEPTRGSVDHVNRLMSEEVDRAVELAKILEDGLAPRSMPIAVLHRAIAKQRRAERGPAPPARRRILANPRY